jgi:hypothetical protein
MLQQSFLAVWPEDYFSTCDVAEVRGTSATWVDVRQLPGRILFSRCKITQTTAHQI